ncbi:MAG: RNA methyltransferase [Moraxella sp.]|nr:RNA methyltransferase [Moraxella sp.]
MISLLPNIRIIMINTTLPANIGSTARAMHTMGLSDLVVVNPRLPIDDTSIANSAGGVSVLKNARIVATLDEAIGDCSLIFASSARSRHLPRPVINPAQSADMMGCFLQNHPNTHIAILFGREDRGLTNDELSLADYHIQIPANPNYPVLNVASSVQVITSNIYAHFTHKVQTNTPQNDLTATIRTDWDNPAITHAQRLSLQDNFTKLLINLNLARDNELKDLPNRLSRLNSRLQLDQKEYALLQALIAKLHKSIMP